MRAMPALLLDGLAKPHLRPLEPLSVELDGEPRVAWRDPLAIAPLIHVPAPLAMLMALLDGTREVASIAEEWQAATGEALPPEFLARLVTELDEFLLLDSPRYRAARAAALEAYRAQPSRPATLAPDGYPDEPEACQSYLDALLGTARSSPPTEPLRGLVAPHIDLHRGAPCYADAYAALAGSGAELFVVLGIAHSTSCWPAPPPLATLTRLDFDTPLGTVRTDAAFVDRLAERYAAAGGSEDLFADELVHRHEHSLELQVIFLQRLFGHRPFAIVPLLLGSLQGFYETPAEVDGPAGLGPLLEAVRETIDADPREVCLIAGADLSHLGPRFGHGRPVDPEWVERCRVADLAELGALGELGAGAYFEAVAAHRNARNVCSVANLYALRRLLPDARFRLLRYEAAVDPQQTVSFAAAALV